ncbi:hypothetical protein [Glaciimonas sp. PCH181]|uniref:hypothetical protein n=1 Tax=Glaciimonas sp. PCH181 TaxID=2133943 RepID=UPI000D34CBE7|nr:hypothetical protein [Glaciimonas sp. PCH181]PUA17711.1 hypothetical protein C7W93_17735 [Glaciimonas sp. PCH181]
MSDVIDICAQDVAANAAHLGIALSTARCAEIVVAVAPTLARVRRLNPATEGDLYAFENALFSLQSDD